MKQLGVYYRVSTDRQDFSSQKTAVEKFLVKFLDRSSTKEVNVYQDHGISGTKAKRPGFQAMLADAFSGKLDTILVYRLDRFSRSANTAIKLILELDEVGVAFISVSQPALNLGHSNPFRRTMLAAFAEIAEIERQSIVTRVKSGLAAAKKRGVKLGTPRKLNDSLKERALQLRAQGLTLRQVAIELQISLGSAHTLLK